MPPEMSEWRFLLDVVEQYPGMIVLSMERFEILRVVRNQNGSAVGTPL
jgi:hypothetical protein